MTHKHSLSSIDVLQRIRAGGVLRLDAAYSYQSCFDGDPVVPHQVMLPLVYTGEVILPQARGQVWSLASVPGAQGAATAHTPQATTASALT